MKRAAISIAAMLFALSGCSGDKTVGGITFKSGRGVDPADAYNEGYAAGVTACRTKQFGFAKYRSDSEAHTYWSDGFDAACPWDER